MERYELTGHLTPLADGQAPGGQLVAVLTAADLSGGQPPLGLEHTSLVKYQVSTACKVEVYPDHLCGAFSTPKHGNHPHRDSFSFCLRGDGLYFLDDTGTVAPILAGIAQTKAMGKATVGHLLFLFLEALVQNDARYLQAVYDRMAALEEGILAGKLESVNHRLSPYRRELLSLHRFYDQLMDVAQTLQINQNGFFTQDTLALFRLFSERTERLLDEAELLREFTMQVREVYQAEIDVRQNRTMNVLTVVTAIFSPLSLIVGWYGMNFTNMPELAWAYGYPAVIALSALTVLVCLLIFKRKKYL